MSATGAHGTRTAERLISLQDAERAVLAAVPGALPCERLALPEALGRVLARDVVCSEPLPRFDGSAMDGYAVRAADLRGAGPGSPVLLRVIDESRAGAPSAAELQAGQAIAISTGAVIPLGADAVVPVEATRSHGEQVEVRSAPAAGEHIRRAGEDVQSGETVLSAGTQVGPAELGALGVLGVVAAPCTRRPRLSLLVTGDELTAAGAQPGPGGVRDSNSLSIAAMACSCGAEVSRHGAVGDDEDATRRALSAALDGFDVAVVCGGVSVGRHDHVKGALAELGAQEVFWGVALRPGKPTWFGTAGQTLVFGLPGNPVSAMVTFTLLVRPAIRALLGVVSRSQPLSAVLDHDYEKPAGRAHALRCRVSAERDGWHASSTGAQGSHVLSSMLAADALAVIPAEASIVRAGERVSLVPLRMWQEPLG